MPAATSGAREKLTACQILIHKFFLSHAIAFLHVVVFHSVIRCDHGNGNQLTRTPASRSLLLELHRLLVRHALVLRAVNQQKRRQPGLMKFTGEISRKKACLFVVQCLRAISRFVIEGLSPPRRSESARLSVRRRDADARLGRACRLRHHCRVANQMTARGVSRATQVGLGSPLYSPRAPSSNGSPSARLRNTLANDSSGREPVVDGEPREITSLRQRFSGHYFHQLSLVTRTPTAAVDDNDDGKRPGAVSGTCASSRRLTSQALPYSISVNSPASTESIAAKMNTRIVFIQPANTSIRNLSPLWQVAVSIATLPACARFRSKTTSVTSSRKRNADCAYPAMPRMTKLRCELRALIEPR